MGINDYAGVIRAAISGMGIAEIPSILCGRELHQGLLVTVIPQWRFEEVDLSAFYFPGVTPPEWWNCFSIIALTM